MMQEDYEIVSVLPSDAPPDMAGSDWHCYVIAQGANIIRGYRRGKSGAVRTAVEEIVSRLNERRIGNRGTVQLVIPSARKRARQVGDEPA